MELKMRLNRFGTEPSVATVTWDVGRRSSAQLPNQVFLEILAIESADRISRDVFILDFGPHVTKRTPSLLDLDTTVLSKSISADSVRGLDGEDLQKYLIRKLGAAPQAQVFSQAVFEQAIEAALEKVSKKRPREVVDEEHDPLVLKNENNRLREMLQSAETELSNLRGIAKKTVPQKNGPM